MFAHIFLWHVLFPIWLLRDEGKHLKTNSRTRTRTSVLWVVSLLFASSSLLSEPPADCSPVTDVYHRLWYLRTDKHVQARTEGFPLFLKSLLKYANAAHDYEIRPGNIASNFWYTHCQQQGNASEINTEDTFPYCTKAAWIGRFNNAYSLMHIRSTASSKVELNKFIIQKKKKKTCSISGSFYERSADGELTFPYL